MSENPYEAIKRTTKAHRLANQLVAAGCDADTAETMPDGVWKQAEQAARVNPSSAETRAMVVKILRERAEAFRGGSPRG